VINPGPTNGQQQRQPAPKSRIFFRKSVPPLGNAVNFSENSAQFIDPRKIPF